MFNKMRLGKRGAEKRFGITTAFLRQGHTQDKRTGAGYQSGSKKIVVLLCLNFNLVLNIFSKVFSVWLKTV